MAKRPAIGIYGGALMSVLLGFVVALGADTYSPPVTIFFSPIFRIRVETSSAPAGQVYSAWADQFLQRLCRLLQWDTRFLSDRALTFRLNPAAEGYVGDLTAEQSGDGQVEQILSIYGTDGANRQILEELLTEAALENHVLSRMTPTARQKGIPVAPRWLSVGLARYLDPELRTQDARWVGDSIEAGVWPRVTEWVTWRNLPQGYAEEKSFSCQALAWILSRPTGAAGVNGLLDSLAMGRQIDAGQIAIYLNFATVAQAEADWKNWLDRQGRMVRFGVDAPRDLMRRLRAQMEFSDEELTRAGVPANLDLTWAGLVDHRRTLWARKLAARKADSLRLMAIGKDRDFRELVEKVVAYLESCSRGRFWPLKSTLRRRYRKLEKIFEQYERTVMQREAYIDRIESDGQDEHVPKYEQGLEKSALRDYVDRVESNLTGGASLPLQR